MTSLAFNDEIFIGNKPVGQSPLPYTRYGPKVIFIEKYQVKEIWRPAFIKREDYPKYLELIKGGQDAKA